METLGTAQPAATRPRIFRVGSVSFLNAKPLLYGLEDDATISLQLDVPSRLLAGLQDGTFDVALLPVIDYQRMEGLRLVPSGGIGSDGPTLTVRIFSRQPIERLTRLACDPDSHTSVALAQIVLAELYGIEPTLVPLTDPADAMLLIGDKVVRDEPAGMDHQLDLGEAWKRLTGMPFVFAAWTARKGARLADLPQKLSAARHAGLQNIDQIITEHAAALGWPAPLARQYLTSNLKFEIAEPQLTAIRHFHELAAIHKLIRVPPYPLKTL
jgi:chorismate dehydratase